MLLLSVFWRYNEILCRDGEEVAGHLFEFKQNRRTVWPKFPALVFYITIDVVTHEIEAKKADSQQHV